MRYYIGLMSGTSLDGVDGALVAIDQTGTQVNLRSASYIPFCVELRSALLALQSSAADEIHRACLAANQLMSVYAKCVQDLLKSNGLAASQIAALGAHGQTVRHRPELGYTVQINNPALLAELTHIDVIADFRSRDIAARGQGAPLVPAFHRAVFGKPGETRIVVNIGGIANVSILHSDGSPIGFDTGPGNVLMDGWIRQHQAKEYDDNGDWARSGNENDALLVALKDEPFFRLAPPKSTGRDLFHAEWLQQKLMSFPTISPVDVQATLCALTAHTIAEAISSHASDVEHVFVCGGGAYNSTLMQALKKKLCSIISGEKSIQVKSTDVLGVTPNHVEAMAFAWLAHRHVERLAGNVAEVTGALGERILGACYPR